jgi:hypothetical protein
VVVLQWVTIVRTLPRALASLTAVVVLLLPSCGGSRDGDTTLPRPPSGSTPVDPCATASAEAPLESEADPTEAALEKRAALRREPRGQKGRLLDALWLHRASRLAERPLVGLARSQDAGEIAVLQDAGDLILLPNTFDLAGSSLRFTRSGDGWGVTRGPSGLRASLGTRVTLEDDDSKAYALAFPFGFYGTRSEVHLNSDGNLTFEEADTASTERSVARVLGGPPRIAPFFADLDPSAGTGRVYVQSAADAFTVTWCGVRGFDDAQTTTAQVSLLPDGAVEMRYGTSIGLRDVIVAVSPGRANDFSPVDLSAGASTTTAATVGERFGSARDLDLAAVARRFYADHPDAYDQLLIWTDTSLVSGNTFAFETTVKNEIQGIGVPVYDTASSFGSGGRLRSVVMMDALAKYPSDPRQKFLGENDVVGLMGQEVGHRWLAFLKFRDASGRTSDALLGRDQAHWSFFMDSDGSVMEGNDIEDLGGGAYRTTDAAVTRYSRLDQYAMGLVAERDVPAFFYVESPTNVQPSRRATDDPQPGVTFNGTKRTVLIADVVEVMGSRSPSSRDSPRVHRQAFLYVISSGRALNTDDVAKIDGFRLAWEPFFSNATERRMRAETRLRP